MTERRKSNNIIGLFICPIVYFALGAVIFMMVGVPVVKPILDSLAIVSLDAPPDFDTEAADIFKTKDIETLPIESDLITVLSSDIPAEGERYGQIISDKASINAPLYYGDGARELSSGVGTYIGSYIPGAGRTILIAGHNNTYFHTLSALEQGDSIKIDTSYGRYEYEVTDSRIAKDTDTSSYDLNRKEENLILYTCYPFDMLGLTPNRYFVYAKYISGPKLNLAL